LVQGIAGGGGFAGQRAVAAAVLVAFVYLHAALAGVQLHVTGGLQADGTGLAAQVGRSAVHIAAGLQRDVTRAGNVAADVLALAIAAGVVALPLQLVAAAGLDSGQGEVLPGLQLGEAACGIVLQVGRGKGEVAPGAGQQLAGGALYVQAGDAVYYCAAALGVVAAGGGAGDVKVAPCIDGQAAAGAYFGSGQIDVVPARVPLLLRVSLTLSCRVSADSRLPPAVRSPG